MAHGPEKALREGTQRKAVIQESIRLIDEKIKKQELPTILVSSRNVVGIEFYRSEIIDAYLRAGWKTVKIICKLHFEIPEYFLVLSTLPEEEMN